MIATPTLFERNPRTRHVGESYVPLDGGPMAEWEAMEWVSGADVRVTIRSGEAVRLEVVEKPGGDQRDRGIEVPWWRDCPMAGPGTWVHDAANSTDFTGIPDGEWEGVAVGEKINRNPLGLEGHRVFLASLFPWRDIVKSPCILPAVGRPPLGFEDLRFWLATTESRIEGVQAPLDGVVWWWHETPVAKIRGRDFAGFANANPVR